MGQTGATLVAAAVGFCVARVTAAARIRTAPSALVTKNVAGRAVPAVLGDAVVAGAVMGAAVLGAGRVAGWEGPPEADVIVAVGVVAVLTGVAGRIDDLRGNESDRGFIGHLRAARGGRLTGGLIKLVAGGLAGVIAGALTESGWDVLVVAGLVALTANFVNLTDTAPGRAGKIALALALPLVILGSEAWAGAAAGLIAALVAVMPHDLGERGMLGDAGANPIGGVMGLGLALGLAGEERVGVLVVVAALNLASEKWSFSRAVAVTPWLRAVDRLGRKGPERAPQ